MAEKYVCGYCGAEYSTPVDRAKCEFECDEKQKQEAERVRQEKLKSERDARVKEIQAAYDQLYKLCDSYEKDYGIRCIWDMGNFFDSLSTLLPF
jgi:hypothetical protein